MVRAIISITIEEIDDEKVLEIKKAISEILEGVEGVVIEVSTISATR